MKVFIVSPSVNSTLGNSVTATRWSGILLQLGHEVVIASDWNGEPCDVLIALHARRSHPCIARFRQTHPLRPLVVALTGTDLYRDLPESKEAQQSVVQATRVIALQSAALELLPAAARAKTTVIYQSARPPAKPRKRSENDFLVCVLSHLREVKDPLRPAMASRLLPADSKVKIIQAGRALDPGWETLARLEEQQNPRFCWLGDQPHEAAVELLTSSDLYVLPSIMEGGANAIAEAVVCGIPILCSDIPGNIGMLGPDYSGYFHVRDTRDLARMLNKAATDPIFLSQLRQHIQELEPRFSPEQELRSWSELLQLLDS
jgi:putative glycosyltransferase (TIGR04348 family)